MTTPGTRSWRLAVVVLTLLTAVLGATVAEFTSEITVDADDVIESNFRGPFDLLVFAGAFDQAGLDPLDDNVFRSNYLSSVGEVLPWDAVDDVRDVPGVSVAAPLSILGTTLFTIFFTVDVSDAIEAAGPGYFLLETSWRSDAGFSEYRGAPTLIYHDPEWTPDEGCSATGIGSIGERGYTVSCVGSGPDAFDSGGFTSLSGEAATYGAGFLMPIVVAVIDPVAETALTGESFEDLIGATPVEAPVRRTDISRIAAPAVFAADLGVDSDPVSTLFGLDVSGPPAEVEQLSVTELRERATGAVFESSRSSSELYQETIDGADVPGAELLINADSVNYGVDGSVLVPELVDRSEVAWSDTDGVYQLLPPGNEDVQFRPSGIDLTVGFSLLPVATVDVRVDSDLQLGLGVHDPPVLETSTGAELGPTMNLGGYLQQPPTAMITRESAIALIDEFSDLAPERDQLADIDPATVAQPTSIRVRVDDELANPEGLAAVAAQISAAIPDATVVSVSGTGIVERDVRLEGNDYGRSTMVVTERWVEGGRALEATEGLAARETVSYVLLGSTLSLGYFLLGLLLVRSQLPERNALRVAGCPPTRAFWVLTGSTLRPAAAAVVAALLIVAVIGAGVSTAGLVGALGLAVTSGSIGALWGIRGTPESIRFRLAATTVPRLAFADLVNRPIPWMLAVALLGVSAGLGGLLIGVHLDLIGVQVGDGVEVLSDEARLRQLWLVVAGIGSAIAVVVFASTSVRLGDPAIEPGTLVGWNRSTEITLRLWRTSVVAAITVAIAAVTGLVAAGPLGATTSTLTLLLGAGIAVAGTAVAER